MYHVRICHFLCSIWLFSSLVVWKEQNREVIVCLRGLQCVGLLCSFVRSFVRFECRNSPVPHGKDEIIYDIVCRRNQNHEKISIKSHPDSSKHHPRRENQSNHIWIFTKGVSYSSFLLRKQEGKASLSGTCHISRTYIRRHVLKERFFFIAHRHYLFY